MRLSESLWDINWARIPVSHTLASVAAEEDSMAWLAVRAPDASNDMRCSMTPFGEQSEELVYRKSRSQMDEMSCQQTRSLGSSMQEANWFIKNGRIMTGRWNFNRLITQQATSMGCYRTGCLSIHTLQLLPLMMERQPTSQLL